MLRPMTGQLHMSVRSGINKSSQPFQIQPRRCFTLHTRMSVFKCSNPRSISYMMCSTPPEKLVSKINFVTANVSRDENSKARMDDLSGGVGIWEGRAVFADSYSATTSSIPNPTATPIKTPSKHTTGSAASPISIVLSSSSPPSPPPQSLPRPRAIPQYTSPSARTAYTPPRFTQPPKPVHPFFARTKSLPPPPSQQPRMIAEYYSTDETASQSTSTTMTQSQESPVKWSVGDREIELITHEIERLGMGDEAGFEKGDALTEEPERLNRAGPSRLSEAKESSHQSRRAVSKPLKSRSTPIPSTSRTPALRASRPQIRQLSTKAETETLPTQKNDTTFQPKTRAKSPSKLPLFSYKTFRPNPPKIAYTTSPSEANDLLSCLEGPVLGFDMEWPIAGWKDVFDPITQEKTRKVVGGTIGPDGKVTWGQCKTALIQVCDKRLVVLIHVWDMKELPSKLVEILQDPRMFKAGVAIKGDAQKLRRDYPTSFPDGISSLLELSHLARKADPINTGPGGVLISLANLTKEYLGRELDKEATVRKGAWMDTLNRKQIDYAANDVVVAVHLYDALVKVADEQGIILRPGDYVSDMGQIQKPGKALIASETNPPRRSTSPEGVQPAKMRAVERFVEGLTCAQIAEERDIKVGSIRAYISEAMVKLPLETMTPEQQARFVADASQDPYAYRWAGVRRLRESLGGQSSEED